MATDSFLPRWDGISRFLDGLLPDLAKKFEVTILAPKFEGKEKEYKNIKLIRFPLFKKQFGDIYFAKPNFKTIKKAVNNSDIIFSQTLGPIGYKTVKYARKKKKKIISYVHSIEWELASRAVKHFKTIIRILVKERAKKYYKKSDLLLVPSKQVEDILEQNKIKTKKKMVTLGVDTNYFVPSANKKQAKKKIGLNPEDTIIGFTGRIAREKDIPTLVRAYKKTKRNHTKTKLLIVGTGLLEEIEKNKDIICAGMQNDVAKYLQAMDIYVMPSLTETSSLSTMEAMSTGCAIIATPVGIIPEYIINKASGLIFPRENSDILAEKINMLLDDEKFRKKLGSNARKTILERYKWADTTKEIIKLIEDLT